MRIILATLTIGLLAGVNSFADNPSDSQALQGLWNVEVQQVRFGNATKDVIPDLRKVTYEIKGNQIIVRHPFLALEPPAWTRTWKFTLRKEKGVRQIDLFGLDGKYDKGKTRLGIYKIEDDVLHLSLSKGKERPTQFKATQPFSAYLKLKRIKK